MNTFAKTAHKIRHSYLLRNADFFWNVLRKPYHRLLNLKNKGVPITFNETLTIRVPPQYYKAELIDYEKVSVSRLIEWIRNNPTCYILDIGCSTGYISTICLFASETATVVGFDSDLASLRASELMSQYTHGNRFSVVYGLITAKSTIERDINKAIEISDVLLSESKLSGNPNTTKYINLDNNKGQLIPEYAIDSLYHGLTFAGPILIKCDIEGAELFALRGAAEFIKQHKPVILLSVHPHILPFYNSTVQQVTDLLEDYGYHIELLSTDHEEHWWCIPN